MKTLLLCLLAASLGAGELQPTGWFVKCDTILAGQHHEWTQSWPCTVLVITDPQRIVCDTTWIYPVVVDTVVRCVKVWGQRMVPIDSMSGLGPEPIDSIPWKFQYEKCDTTYRRRP
jgi:hypothetical protein